MCNAVQAFKERHVGCLRLRLTCTSTIFKVMMCWIPICCAKHSHRLHSRRMLGHNLLRRDVHSRNLHSQIVHSHNLYGHNLLADVRGKLTAVRCAAKCHLVLCIAAVLPFLCQMAAVPGWAQLLATRDSSGNCIRTDVWPLQEHSANVSPRDL